MKRAAAGFTMIELLVVIVVLGILVLIAIPRLYDTKERAFVTTLKHDLRHLASAQDAYFSDNQTYAGTLTDLGRLYTTSRDVNVAIDSASGSGWGATATHPGTATVCEIASGVQSVGPVRCTTP